MTEKEYDDLYNEGGEGFNPYRPDMDKGEPLWSKVESRMSKVQRSLNGIGDEAFDAERKATLTAEYVELKALYATMSKN